MNNDSLDLLRRLGGGGASAAQAAARVGPIQKGGEAGQVRTPGGASFADLLKKAGGGELASGLPVTVDDGAAELSDEQLERVGRAADRAEAEGFTTAIVHIDGHQIILDVGARRVTGRVDADNPVARNIDGVVFAPPAEGGVLAGAADAAGGIAKGAAETAQAALNLPRKALLKLLDRRPPGLAPDQPASGSGGAHAA